jgi:hypothetical protein
MKLLALNTIGLTGVEVFQYYLAQFEEVAVLPGQNFAIHSQNLYRPHDFVGQSATEVFAVLNRHLVTKDGRTWMGLTKHMDQVTREGYRRDLHRAEFLRCLGDQTQYFDYIKAYCTSYFLATGRSELTAKKWVAYYSCNVVLNLASTEYSGQLSIINVGNKIDYWLASISQTRTWNCLEACKFWLVNNLYLMRYRVKHPEFQSFLLEDLIDEPEGQLNLIRSFLGIGAGRVIQQTPGLITPNLEMIDATRQNAKILRQIYCDEPLFKLADTLEEWGQDFLEISEVTRLLDRFAIFWKTTSHTNFDWVGPIAEEVVDLALSHYGSKGRRNINVIFYHEYFELHSDSHDLIESHLHHFLGCLEEEILLPHLPYYLKVAIRYLTSVSRNYVYHSHSYVPVRKSDIYRRLSDSAMTAKINRFGLAGIMGEMEEAIDAAENACAHLLGDFDKRSDGNMLSHRIERKA